ncbi:hypothetical protein E2C01_037657 [Portunus trituberculatus]|uniref:Uncharacterized protein n=1 Tax=Portunus trituberculatus TaxID=210409 RepID=A0A5B7FG78_PORTR|nr:hypothetical protein [Portunus trituberculatus]
MTGTRLTTQVTLQASSLPSVTLSSQFLTPHQRSPEFINVRSKSSAPPCSSLPPYAPTGSIESLLPLPRWLSILG